MNEYKSGAAPILGNLIKEKSIEFKEFDLSNGLHCVLYKDNSFPILDLTIGYKVGSKDDGCNKKGIAHLFEHMMFQGSGNIKKNEHFNYVHKSGGICNAFTMPDATVYFEKMPANKLEMALWLESDRMNSLDMSPDNLENQKNVVIEEKKQINDNAPYGSLFPNIFKNVFKGSDYETAVIGEIDDIRSVTTSDASEFHNNYYTPENSVLVVSGDIGYHEAEELIRKYFSDIKKVSGFKRKKNIVPEIPQDINLSVHDNVQLSVLNICFQIPKIDSKENYIFEYIVEILANNKSSRLYNELVYKKKLLRSIRAIKFTLEDSGLIILKATLNPGVSAETIKNEIWDVINNLAIQGCTDLEFDKIKNQIEFDNIAKYQKLQNISVETVFNYIYFKDVMRMNEDVKKYMTVSKQDVKDSVNNFIVNKNKFILTYLPKN